MAEMDEREKRHLANSIIGKEGAAQPPDEAEEDSEPDNSNEAPSHKIERMTLERAHNGYVCTHHYVPPEPAATPEASTAPEHKHQPPRTLVFRNPEELHDHVKGMLKHMSPPKEGIRGGSRY